MDQSTLETAYARDPYMLGLCRAVSVPPLAPVASEGIFHVLIRSLVSQQLSTVVADKIFRRLLDMLDVPQIQPGAILRFSEEDFRGIGFSRQKARYAAHAALHFEQNPDLEYRLVEMTDEEIIRDLTQIKGVGEWTVQMLLMFELNRPDVFPVKDLGIRQAMGGLYELDEAGLKNWKGLEAMADSWRPFRSHACRLLWHWKGLGMPPIQT